MQLRTQVGGKYSTFDSSVFKLKRTLIAAGISVSHPIADRILSTEDGRNYAFDSAITSFSAVEHDYYKSISNSSFHTVCNVFMEHRGYVGRSAALEVCYAMLASRPIIMLHAPVPQVWVAKEHRALILERQSLFTIANLLELSPEEVAQTAEGAASKPVDYELTNTEQDVIGSAVVRLLADLGYYSPPLAPASGSLDRR